MQIKETTTMVRANTSIDWPPGRTFEPSSNNLFRSSLGVDFTRTITLSNDELTQTSVVTWNNKPKYIEVHMSTSDSDRLNWFNTSLVTGLTITKVIEVTE